MIPDVDRIDGGFESIPLNEQLVVVSWNEFDSYPMGSTTCLLALIH